MKAPPEIQTRRLLLRRPQEADATAIFASYSGDETLGRYIGWAIHRSLKDARAFLDFAKREWVRWPAGPYLICLGSPQRIIGSTGLVFETPERASTGYVIAHEHWGNGFATEAVTAIKPVAEAIGVKQLVAYCHPAHRPSQKVLEKAGFSRQGTLRMHSEFPNLAPGILADVVCYAWLPAGAAG